MRWTWIVLICLFAGCKTTPVTIQVFAEKEWRTNGQPAWVAPDTRLRVQANIL